MKFGQAAVAAVVVVGVILGLREWRASQMDVSADAPMTAMSTGGARDPSVAVRLTPADSKDGGSTERPRSTAAPAILQLIGDEYRFNPTDTANTAVSEADAKWLGERGFPDPHAYGRLRKASLDELKEAAKLDLRAQVILAYNMAVIGSYGDEPLKLLEDAAVRGSVFALMTWGDVHFTLPRYRNAAMGSAYYSLAFRRGYFTAATANYALTTNMPAEQRLLADVFAEATWARIQASRRTQGMQPFQVADMRPGFEAFLSSIEAGIKAQEGSTE